MKDLEQEIAARVRCWPLVPGRAGCRAATAAPSANHAATGLSERTLRRYLAQYRAEDTKAGPKARKSQPAAATIPEEVLQQAILLRREVGTGVSTIIDILRWNGWHCPGKSNGHPPGTPGGERLQLPP